MIRRLLGSSVLRLFSSAVIDQALLSGASFALTVLLIRNTPDTHYGLYVLAQSAVQLVVSAHGAYVNGPLSILGNKRPEADRRAMVGAVDHSLGRILGWLLVVLLPLAPLAWALGLLDGLRTLVVVAGLLAAWRALRREYSRTVLLMYAKPNVLLLTDLLYVAVLLGGAAFAAFGPFPGVAAAIATLALALAALAGDRGGRVAVQRMVGWQAGDAAAYWKQMRPLAVWATVGAVTYWLLSQSYNPIVAAKLDVAAVAAINVARQLLMPTYLLANGVKGLLVPMSARWLHEEGLDALLRKLSLFIVGIGVLSLGYFAVLWMARGWLLTHVMKKSYPQIDAMILGWGTLVLINLVRDMYQNALLARERFKPLAGLVAGSALVSIAGMWIAIDHLGAEGVLVGMIVGETTYLIAVLAMLIVERRRDAAERAALS